MPKRSNASWPVDISRMHTHYATDKWVETATTKQKEELMKLRMRMLLEEFNETMQAYLQSDCEELVDGLVDLMVIATGTLDLVGVDANKAWDAIYEANMNKIAEPKPGRPNPHSLPDLNKPDDWVGPDHSDNHGNMKEWLLK